jgi:hypothetical protein
MGLMHAFCRQRGFCVYISAAKASEPRREAASKTSRTSVDEVITEDIVVYVTG